MPVLGELGQQQADHSVADHDVVGLGDLGQGAVALVVHLADDRVVLAERALHVTQLQQRHEGARVGVVGVEAVVGQHDDVLEEADAERLQGEPVGGVAVLDVHREVAQAGQVRARLGVVGGDLQD